MQSSIFFTLVLALLSPLVFAECTRGGINSALDRVFTGASSIQKPPLNLSPSIKITSNGYIQTSLNTTPWSNITTLYTPSFKVQAIDTTACQGARYTVVTQLNSSGVFPALLSLRLALSDKDGPITELEFMNVIRGDHMLFSPQRFEQRTPALFNSSQAFPPGARITRNTTILSRADLIKTANSYLEGVEKGDNTLVRAGPNCPRVSNGYQTSAHCDQGLEQFKWPVVNRRWIADTETGVAFGAFIFKGALMVNNQTGDYINEYLAVKDGKLRGIRAVMFYTQKNIKSVWPEDAERIYASS